ncbi:SDR family oxidoreductase [Acuticoccus mangrovi]|uniref:SDR family oxidoreductase n=1 Tax=Acuticoccus mangrovi TaxID=2796142 RepID=A0A934IEW0_9HYPH|nr:SDR family NAD(P)-dependent oxidoreductase [Acuticoccus mangrovi]MBJ3775339.1 SDR family oxidoreductase [Acuticoccus mangrovi]
MSQERKVALVTGAASGIGRGIAERFARDGMHVVAVDRSPAVAEAAEEMTHDGGSAESAVVDLADLAAIDTLVADIGDRLGRLDVLVNNAGISPKIDGKRAVSETMPMDQWEDVLRVNLTAPFYLCRLALPFMRKRWWGRIINMSSRAGRMLVPTAGAHYAASKAGLIGMSRVIANEHAADGITVNCIAPGRIVTPLSEQGSAEMLAALKAEIPVGRAGTPADVAALAAYIVSPEAAFVTGVVFDFNGGVFMN